MKGTATVIKHTGSHYLLSELPQWELFPAVLRGRIRLRGGSATNPVAVGDIVDYETDGPEGTAAITAVHPRRNYLIRKSTNLSRQNHVIAANIDRAFLVVTLAFPELKLPFLDRLLVTCEVYGVRPVIVLNKTDIFRGEFAEDFAPVLDNFHRIYSLAGYDVIEVSARTGEGIDRIHALCAEGVSLFSGESGVGKSSIIKALDPSLDPRTAEISDAHLQVRHTTTFYEMYRTSAGEFIIDTPGIRGFGLVDLTREEIPLYFPEMLRESRGCRFTPCTHTHEPGCAVKLAMEEGRIAPERYNSYLGMLEDSSEGKYR